MPMYLSGHWNHMFKGEEHERMTRVVIDVEAKKLVFAQVQRIRSITSSYSEALQPEMLDLADSIENANSDLFDDPSDFGLVVTEGIPEWAANLV